MSLYLLLKTIHVLLAMVAVGANVSYAIWLQRAARDPQHLDFALRGIKFLDDRLANPAYVLLLLTGLGMILVAGIPWTTPWILSSIVLYALMAGIGLLGYTPLLRRQIAALESYGTQSQEYRTVAAQALLMGLLIVVLVLTIIFLMVTKPKLWG